MKHGLLFAYKQLGFGHIFISLSPAQTSLLSSRNIYSAIPWMPPWDDIQYKQCKLRSDLTTHKPSPPATGQEAPRYIPRYIFQVSPEISLSIDTTIFRLDQWCPEWSTVEKILECSISTLKFHVLNDLFLVNAFQHREHRAVVTYCLYVTS